MWVFMEMQLVLFTISAVNSKSTWKYGDSDLDHAIYGPKAWGNVASSCRQSDQSPIDIVTDDVEADSSLGELDITCDNEKGLFNGILLNNGHEPVLTADGARGICNLTGASLKNKYFQLHDLNIHFGCDTDRGSEHTIDGKPFPAELQLMFYNTDYGSFENAAPLQDGLAAISVLLEIGKSKNVALDSIVDQVDDVAVEGSSIPIYTPADNLTLADLVPELANEHVPYYTYRGSLTVPPCYQSVRWIVMKNPVAVTKEQLSAFKKLTSKQGSVCDNFRPATPLNDRKVEANF
ncbi:carbonic anhydrase 2-like [Acropora palmata]|uniref:carbonic anhydrase 2-like n=1 Tax=Acropora palmata TaxID=6131 RepID=UPI003DA13329